MKTITKFHNIESFETSRLSARRLESADLEKLTIMHTNPHVMATLGGIRTGAQTQENMHWNLAHWEKYGFGKWMFYLKNTQEWVGYGALRHVNVEGQAEIEVGYALMPKFWKQGIATEIAKACIEIAFEVLWLKNIVCFTLTTNQASQRVMEKAGFQYERKFVMHYEGIDYPHLLYRMKNYRETCP